MTATVLQLPDLVLTLRRDGSVRSWAGGNAVPELRKAFESGRGWDDASQALIKRLTRQCIAQRAPVEIRLPEGGREYEVRLTPQGPDRAVCSVRPVLGSAADETGDATGIGRRPGLDRRAFIRRLRDSVSHAKLLERPLAVVVLHIDGLPDIAHSVGSRIADDVLNQALRRIPPGDGTGALEVPYYVGQINENALAIVLEIAARRDVESRVADLCAALGEPVEAAGIEFKLVCYAGAALLGIECATPTQLLDRASAAALEARRAGSRDLRFHSETVKVRMLERIDLAKELRDAVARREIGLRFVPRHDLASGALTALVSYLRWEHPLRGEIRPAEFLRIAGSTGFGPGLSRAVLGRLGEDFQRITARLPAGVSVSFGALRDHVFDADFVGDIESLVAQFALPAERLELRVAESTFVSRDLADLAHLRRLGVRLLVDELGRDMSSLALLARSQVWGVQVDRAWVSTLAADPVAASVCRATASMAAALGVEALAAGVDDEDKRDLLLDMGFRFGTGDLYRAI